MPVREIEVTNPLDLLTVKNVADIFSVKPETVRDWINQERFPALRLPDGSYRVNRAYVVAWAQTLYGENK